MTSQRGIGVVARMLTGARESITMKLLPPRHLSAEERRAIQRRVANDPNVDRAVKETLSTRPEFRRNGSTKAEVHGRPEQ